MRDCIRKRFFILLSSQAVTLAFSQLGEGTQSVYSDDIFGDVIMPMRIGTPMPALDGATEWFNGSAEEALKRPRGPPRPGSFLVAELRDVQREFAPPR